MTRVPKCLLAVCLVAAAVLPSAAGAKGQPAFTFGRRGGTILPFTVKIFPDGRVVATGAIRTIEHVIVTPEALSAMRKLANAEHFFAMRAYTNCHGTVGGLASNYIRVRIGRRAKTVSLRGGCNKRFLELFDVLQAVAAVSTTPRSP
jgi:hypothetical protein